MQLKINANKLKQLRESRCWSQQQLADMSGLSLRTVQRIEAKSVASQESVKCLGAVFDIAISELFADDVLTDNPAPDSSQPDKEALSAPSSIENDHNKSLQTEQGKLEIRKLHIAFWIVLASHLFGFYGIFSAFGEQRIDESTFQLLKNTVSIALVISAIVYFFKHNRLKKKYGLGSSLL